MSIVGVEEHDSPMDAVFLIPRTRWCEPRERLYLMVDLKQSLHPLQRIQTQFRFRAREPAHQAVIEHIMTAQQRIVEDFEDGTRSIDDCLEVGFRPNKSVVRLSQRIS